MPDSRFNWFDQERAILPFIQLKSYCTLHGTPLRRAIKRVAYGLTNFPHHRVRGLLYAGQPDWPLLATTDPTSPTGPPAYLRFDGGPEFVAHAVADWARFTDTGCVFIDPGSPWQNAWIESFNGETPRGVTRRPPHQWDSLL